MGNRKPDDQPPGDASPGDVSSDDLSSGNASPGDALPEDVSPHDEAIDKAFVAYLQARDAGRPLSRESLLESFPELQGQLNELLDTADLIEQLIDSKPPDGGSLVGGSPSASETPPVSAEDMTLEIGVSRNSQTGVTEAGDKANDGAIQSARLSIDSGRANGPSMDVSANLALDETLAITPTPGDHDGPALPYRMRDYVLNRVLGRGGMGVVYLATQTNLDRPVAVKMIRSGMLAGPEEIRRFTAEAKAAAKLNHPHIVSVHHFGVDAGHYYFSMDYVEGFDLSQKVSDRSCDAVTAARYVRDVAYAIHHAHQRGLLHRDLKPANVLVDAADEIHITDFGLAKQLDAESSLSNSGAAIGTPNYMAPEQAAGEHDRAGPQSDVYSLGAILFALLAGRPPFVTNSIMKTLMQVIHRPAPSLCQFCDAPVDVDSIVAKCLRKSPADRYASAKELGDDLQRFIDGQPTHARPRTAMRRCADWLCDVPVVAALMGRRLHHASDHHQRFQKLMLLSMPTLVLLLIGCFFVNQMLHQRLPRQTQIASGTQGDAYWKLADELARRLQQNTGHKANALATAGTVENRQRLLNGDSDLAIMQASAVRGDQVAVVAPLYFEAVHVLVRSGTKINSINQIAGQRVAVGNRQGGSQLVARMLFDSAEIADDVSLVFEPFADSLASQSVNVAVICVARGSKTVAAALQDDKFGLLAIDESLQLTMDHPTLRPLRIEATDYPGAGIDPAGVVTVGTTAFLATRRDSSRELVLAVLHALYQDPPPVSAMISRSRAAEWQGLAFHPAARAFYAADADTE